MFHVFEISAAPHLPFALRSTTRQPIATAEPSTDAIAIARELLADGVILTAAVN